MPSHCRSLPCLLDKTVSEAVELCLEKVLHSNGLMVITGSNKAAFSMAAKQRTSPRKPISGVKEDTPRRFKRFRVPLSAVAIPPMQRHAPHCTDMKGMPEDRSVVAMASRVTFAAQ